jgi:GntR family transcriptional regulator/MocR family aminotransferase
MPQLVNLDVLALDRSSAMPLHRQLYNLLRNLIHDGSLRAGTALPSSRMLAKDLDLGRNTVVAAFDQLVAEGYLLSRAGARATVVDLALPRPTARLPAAAPKAKVFSRRGDIMVAQPSHRGATGQVSFHPGLPDAQAFPFGALSRFLARRARSAGGELFGSHSVLGYPSLRSAIASYLSAARGVRCRPQQVVVTTGAQAALDILARLLIDPGDAVWMEEPGYLGAQAAFASAGALLSPLHVRGSHWDFGSPAGFAPRLIYLTPSCHHPMGATMRMEQRLQILEIATTKGAWIIEDDFDSEYRIQGQPVPAMQGFDRSEQVIYLGTFAKTLFPALRLGFMVVPEAMADGIQAALSVTGQFAPLLLQAALSDFMVSGQMARHLRRTRRLYAARRQVFSQQCKELLGEWLTLVSAEAGMQMVGLLRPDFDDAEVALAAAEKGISVAPLSIHYRHGAKQRGLVMGYAGTPETAMRRRLMRLHDVLRNAAAGRGVRSAP